MKNILLILLISLLAISCADEKKLKINNIEVTVKPYGWANSETIRNDSVNYQINGGNVVLDIIFVETIFVPVYLTGWQLYEPVNTKK